jgi:hypothetical protein
MLLSLSSVGLGRVDTFGEPPLSLAESLATTSLGGFQGNNKSTNLQNMFEI